MVSRALFTRALLAYSVYEHQEGRARRIDVWLRPESFTVQDDGRGMGLDREGYVEGLMGLLVGRPGILQLHGVGLSLIAASTPRLEVESRRGGSLWKQSFAWGVADGPPLREPAGPQTGTRITFVGQATSPEVEVAELAAQINLWREWNPELTIALH
jgi:DNA gyrase/topoisomerase IV subunit B